MCDAFGECCASSVQLLEWVRQSSQLPDWHNPCATTFFGDGLHQLQVQLALVCRDNVYAGLYSCQVFSDARFVSTVTLHAIVISDAGEGDHFRRADVCGVEFSLLADFEKSDMPFDRYLPIMLKKLPEYAQ